MKFFHQKSLFLLLLWQFYSLALHPVHCNQHGSKTTAITNKFHSVFKLQQVGLNIRFIILWNLLPCKHELRLCFVQRCEAAHSSKKCRGECAQNWYTCCCTSVYDTVTLFLICETCVHCKSSTCLTIHNRPWYCVNSGNAWLFHISCWSYTLTEPVSFVQVQNMLEF
jgi:hypothetical protein